MKCTNCGNENPEDARFCQTCGTALRGGSGPILTKEGRAWWYPIGVWAVLSAFFLFVDAAFTGAVTWSIWPIGFLGIFMVGFTLLRYADERSRRK